MKYAYLETMKKILESESPRLLANHNPVGKIAKKTVWKSAALKIQCHVVKNTLLLAHWERSSTKLSYVDESL